MPINQWNKKQNLDPRNIFVQLIFAKGAKAIQREYFFNKWC